MGSLLSQSFRTEKSYCRFCHALCGIEVDIEDGRVVDVRGDRDNPYSQGFICVSTDSRVGIVSTA